MWHEDTFLLIPQFKQLIWGTRQGRDANGGSRTPAPLDHIAASAGGAELEWSYGAWGHTIMLEKDAPVG